MHLKDVGQNHEPINQWKSHKKISNEYSLRTGLSAAAALMENAQLIPMTIKINANALFPTETNRLKC